MKKQTLTEESTMGTSPTPKKDQFIMEAELNQRTVKVLQFNH